MPSKAFKRKDENLLTMILTKTRQTTLKAKRKTDKAKSEE